MEICVTILAVFGNILNIIVLWEVSFTHPAQALRLALAVTDFFTGITHCFLAICDHIYFLWCARDIDKCDYEVDIVLFSNRLEIIRSGYPMFAAIVFMITFTSSFAYLVVSAVDRFIAIYRPLDYPSIVTMKLVRTQILFWMCLSIAYTFGMITRGDYTSWKSAYRPDDKTTIVFMDPYHYFVNGIVHRCYFFLVIIVFLGLILSTLWYLKKAGRARRALTSKSMKDETEIEMTKTLIFVIFAFLFSVVPSYTRHFFGRRILCNYVNFFVTWLFLSSSTMNFLIYNVRNPAFRRRTCQILRKGLSTLTVKLQLCQLTRDEIHKDQQRNEPNNVNNMPVDASSYQNQRLKFISGTKLFQNDFTTKVDKTNNPLVIQPETVYDTDQLNPTLNFNSGPKLYKNVSMSKVGKTNNSLVIQPETMKYNDNDPNVYNWDGHNNNTTTNNNRNINQISSDGNKCNMRHSIYKNQMQTSDIYIKENVILHNANSPISSVRRSEENNIYTMNFYSNDISAPDYRNQHNRSNINKDVKYRLKEDKVEFTLHM